MSGKIRRKSVGIQNLSVVFDDGIGNERRYDPRNEDEENNAEALKLPLGLLREKLLHPDGSHLHEHDIAASEEEQADQQRPVPDGAGVNVFRTPKETNDPHADKAE